MSPFLLPAGVAVLLLLVDKTRGALTTAPQQPVDPNPEPVPEPGPQVQPQPPAGTPLPPLVRGGIFPVGTIIRAVNTPSGAFIHNAPNALVSTRIGRIANGSKVAVLEAGPPSPDDQGGPNTWIKISTASGMSGFIAESLLGPASTAGTVQQPAAPPPEPTPGVSATTTDGDFVFVDPLGNTHNVPASGVVLVDPITGLLNAAAEPGKLLGAAFSGLSHGAWASPRTARRPAYGQARFAPPMARVSGPFTHALAAVAQQRAAQQYPRRPLGRTTPPGSGAQAGQSAAQLYAMYAAYVSKHGQDAVSQVLLEQTTRRFAEQMLHSLPPGQRY